MEFTDNTPKLCPRYFVRSYPNFATDATQAFDDLVHSVEGVSIAHAQIFGTYDVSSPRASKWRCCLVHGFSLSVEKRWRAEWSSAVHILFFRTPRSLRLGSHIIDRVDGDREETSRRLLLADIRVIRGMRNIDLPTSSETQNVPVNKIAWTQINRVSARYS